MSVAARPSVVLYADGTPKIIVYRTTAELPNRLRPCAVVLTENPIAFSLIDYAKQFLGHVVYSLYFGYV